MKKILLIAIVLLSAGSSFAQTNESNLVKDTVIIGNQVMVRVSKCNYTYVDSVPLPYEGASPSGVYRIAKTTKVLEVLKKMVLFRTTLTEYYDVYKYNTTTREWNKEKDQKIVTNPEFRKSTFILYFLIWFFIIMFYLLLSWFTKNLFGKMIIALTIFVIIIIVLSLTVSIYLFGWEFYIPSVLILLVIFFIERKRIQKS